MSSRDWKFRIQDILFAIDKIEKYTSGKTLEEFIESDIVMDAVIRNFEIIGEASKSIPLSIRDSYAYIPWVEMSGMRDILIHQYFGVDLKVLWHTATEHLPPLKTQLETLLGVSAL